MSDVYDLDKLKGKDLLKIGSIVCFHPISKSKIKVYRSSDADEIVELLKRTGITDKIVLDRNYWLNYNETCSARFSPRKILRRIKGGKARRGYFTKYNVRKMMSCPKHHQCPNKQCQCRPISKYLAVTFACGCRLKADAAGGYTLGR